jgi:hypothetical protein
MLRRVMGASGKPDLIWDKRSSAIAFVAVEIVVLVSFPCKTFQLNSLFKSSPILLN